MSPRVVPGQVWRWMTDDEQVRLTIRVSGEQRGPHVPVQYFMAHTGTWTVSSLMPIGQFGTRYRLWKDAEPVDSKRKGGL